MMQKAMASLCSKVALCVILTLSLTYLLSYSNWSSSGTAADRNFRESLQRIEQRLAQLQDGTGHQGVINMEVSDSSTLKRSPRVCCFIMTDPRLLPRTANVRDTWARRCDKALFMSSVRNDSFPTIGLGKDTFGRNHLATKARKSWIYMYTHHLTDCDFTLKGDPDTYIVVENLKNFLSSFDPEVSQHFGHRYHSRDTRFREYMAGGPGVILSRAALRDLVEKGFRSENSYINSCMLDGRTEDWPLGLCLHLVRSKPVDTRDSLGRQRFIVLELIDIFSGNFPQWYIDTDMEGATMGINCCSDYPIGFHYVRDNNMLVLEYLLYRTKKKSNIGFQKEVRDSLQHVKE